MGSSLRPDLAPTRSKLDRALEVAALLAILSAGAIVARSWSTLPNRVPKHFGASGLPDAFGSKSHALAPALLALGLYVLFTLVQLIPPRFYNYPARVTEDTAHVQYRLARSCLTFVKAGISVVLACGTWLTVQVALGQRDGLGMWFLPVAVLAALLPMLWFGAAAYRQRKASTSP